MSQSRCQSKESDQTQSGTLYNDKRRRHSSPSYAYTEQQSCKICEAKTDRTWTGQQLKLETSILSLNK